MQIYDITRRAAFPNAAETTITIPPKNDKTTAKFTFFAVGAIINRPQYLMQIYDIIRSAAFPNAAAKHSKSPQNQPFTRYGNITSQASNKVLPQAGSYYIICE